MNSIYSHNGRLSIICGPMYAKKTTKLLNVLNVAHSTGTTVLYINHSIDNRIECAGNECYTTHNKLLDNGVSSFNQIKTNKLENIGLELMHSYDSIYIINSNILDEHNITIQYDKTITIDEIIKYSNNYKRTLFTNININNTNNTDDNSLTICIISNSYNSYTYNDKNIIYIDKLNNNKDLTIAMLYKYHIIGIDEGQFFNDIEYTRELVLTYGKDIIISALNADSNMKSFGNIKELICLADDVKLAKAKCMKCMLIYNHGRPQLIEAAHTFKLDVKTDEYNNIIDVGSSDKYIATCLKCHIELTSIFSNNYNEYLIIRKKIFDNLQKLNIL